MALSLGDQLGHYKIQSLIGRGGMGEVYRAVDTKLEREVAVKVLPAALAADPERLARFEREAKVLAQLNHPGIASIHGVEDRALIMELIPGPTLADRIKQGPIPAEEAETILLQIADALEYAHERGVIHRDLKPANIKIDPEDRVKILDFGLAKALIDPASMSTAADPTDSPTITMGGTLAGTILGTAAYMAPEQARGKKVDRRADNWAFGVVAWEMLTGERLFQGEDTVQVLSNVLQQPVDLERVPAKFRKVLGRCLDRNPKDRLRDIGEARFLLEDGLPVAVVAPASESSPSPPSRSGLGYPAWVLAGAITLAAIALGFLGYRHYSEEVRITRTFILPPEGASLDSAGYTPAVSPDGRRVAFSATVDGQQGLWIRDLDALSARLLPGTTEATFPFWSPDSRWVAFFTTGKLKKIDVTGGPVLTICDTTGTGRGGTWNTDDLIVYGSTGGSLYRVPAAGGTATALSAPNREAGENNHRDPWFLPGGRRFLYTAVSVDRSKYRVYTGGIDAKPGSKTMREVLAVASKAVYASGFLLFVRERTLMAVRFDAAKEQIAGEAVPIAERVDYFPGQFSVSQNGVLVYSSGSNSRGTAQLTWFDRTGKQLGTVGTPAIIRSLAISPDGGTVAVGRRDERDTSTDIWLHDMARGGALRFTAGPGLNSWPIWSPDGSRIVFFHAADPDGGPYWKAVNGAGKEEVVTEKGARVTDWSHDGRYLIAQDFRPGSAGIRVYPQQGDKKPFAYVEGKSVVGGGKLSPNGKWLAYVSNESNRNEVYVQSFPEHAGKWQVSIDGGTEPVWSRDGRELYFMSADSKMMAVKINTAGGKFQASVPQALFDVRLAPNNPNFDVSKDGRFLIPTYVIAQENATMTVVLNWQVGLKK